MSWWGLVNRQGLNWSSYNCCLQSLSFITVREQLKFALMSSSTRVSSWGCFVFQSIILPIFWGTTSEKGWKRHNHSQSLIRLIFKDFYAEIAGLGLAEFNPAWEKIQFACPLFFNWNGCVFHSLCVSPPFSCSTNLYWQICAVCTEQRLSPISPQLGFTFRECQL